MAPAYEAEPNLGMIARAIWDNKRRVIGPTLAIAVATFIVVNLMTPLYRSEARVLVEGRDNVFLRAEAERSVAERQMDAEAVTSQVQVILSRDLARDVIKTLRLDQVPELLQASELSFGALLSRIGLGRDPSSTPVEERVLDGYFERVSAYPVDGSRVIAIEFRSADPELAARVANGIAESYLLWQQRARQEQARAAGKWLSSELDDLRKRVHEAEEAVEAFRAKSNLIMGANNMTLSRQQLSDLNSQVSQLRAQKADAEAKAGLIRNMLKSGQSIESSEITNSELIRRLSEQRMTLRAELAQQSSTLLPQHPRIRELNAQIANLDQQIRQEGERLVRTLEADAKVSEARLQSLTESFNQLKQIAASSGGSDVKLRALEREAKAQRDLFESYLAKYRETTARDSIAAAPADARIISHAVVSGAPYFPKKMPIVMIASLATFALCSAFVVTGVLLGVSAPPRAVAVEALPEPDTSETLSTPAAFPRAARDVSHGRRAEDRVGVTAAPETAPTLVPSVPSRSMRGPAARAAEDIDEVAAMLLAAGEAGRRVAVIGTAREVGTTLTAIALARSLARKSRVVLVELSFASPNIEVISNDAAAPGIADLVRGAAAFSDIITRDRFSKVHLVAAGKLNGDARLLMGSPVLKSAVDALAHSYGHLVIDIGSQTETNLEPVLELAPRAVLVAGTTSETAAQVLRGQMMADGFTDVLVMAGPPPSLDHGAMKTEHV